MPWILTLGGAAEVSKKTEAFYGYYECRMKASGISMSSTFWMSNRGKNIPGVGRISQELDIKETIGGSKKQFRTRMNSVTETYNWEIPPTPDEISNTAINTTLIDWIRAYTLIPSNG